MCIRVHSLALNSRFIGVYTTLTVACGPLGCPLSLLALQALILVTGTPAARKPTLILSSSFLTSQLHHAFTVVHHIYLVIMNCAQSPSFKRLQEPSLQFH